MNNTWGIELWDQRDVIEKHTTNGIDFLDKYANFVKERVRIEQDYAKSLRRLVKQYQFKKKGEDDLPYTYLNAFKDFLQETDDFAGQREVIAEEIKNKVLNDMHRLSSDSKNERKKALQNLNDLKSHLDQLNKALQVAKSRYDKASEDSATAYKNYEAASNSLDMTKAQILKFQKTSTDKKQSMDKAKEDYSSALENFNKTQTLYYDADFPNCVNNELQNPEENRIKKIASYFHEMANIQKKVQPIITTCLDGMIKAGDSCDPAKDSLTLTDRHKTGENKPSDVVFEEWGKGGANGATLSAHSPAPVKMNKKQTKSTKVSNKKKEQLADSSVANDFSNLPPAQRRNKFNKTITTLNEQISQQEKAKAGMLKIQDTSKQFGGNNAAIADQISVCDKEISRLRSLLHQYQCYLGAMDGNTAEGKNSRPLSTVSTDSMPQPPEAQPQQQPQQQDLAPPVVHVDADEFDEAGCSVLYDFIGTNEGEMSVYSGEQLVVVEEDDGSGWTRVLRGDEEGYIPTSYVLKI